MAQVTIRLTSNERQALEQMARSECRSVRDQARWLIRNQVENYIKEDGIHEQSKPAVSIYEAGR